MTTKTIIQPVINSITEFNQKVQKQFDLMCKTGKLFRVELKGDAIWDLYLKAFAEIAKQIN